MVIQKKKTLLKSLKEKISFVRQTVRQGCCKTDVEKIESRRPKMFHSDSHEIPEGFKCPDGKII